MPPLTAALDDVPLGPSIEAIYAGVDWISCSLPAGAPEQEVWQITGLHIINTIAKEGHDLEAYTRNGYAGYGAGGCFVGTRHDGSYLQLSGYRAGDFLDMLYRDDLHISRIDLQTTVKYRVYAPGVGERVYKSAVDANGAIHKSRQRKIWYMSGNDGGYTCYIGAPTSEQRAKVYNKAVQSSDVLYERCWRWEVTAKNEYATSWWQDVAKSMNTRASLCARIVASWFAIRGVTPEWAAYIPLIALPLIKEVPSDAEKRLRWLKEQVRPAVHWLLERGFEKELWSALDIDPSGADGANSTGSIPDGGNDA